jgi:hypothetical protein
MIIRFAICLLIFTALTVASVSAQSKPAAKAQVMILGTYHFENPGLDYVKSELDDHLSEKRQQQILEVVELLAKFKPTKIVVEAEPAVAERLQTAYDSWLKGERTLKASEMQQIGFRLAKQFGHKKLYPADHKLDMDFNAVMATAQQTGNRQFLEFFGKVMVEVQEYQKRLATMTVREALIFQNAPKQLSYQHDIYLQLARVGADGKFTGADVLASWYQRNFRIFTNLTRVIESPEDRVLVIFGAGHAALLRELTQSSYDLQLIEPNDFLGQDH